MGSPPPAGSKNVVLKFRSVGNVVIAPAEIGKDKTSKKAVIKTDQTNNGSWWKPKPGARILKIVVMKFIAPKMDEIPARCRLKIAKSTAAEE